MPDNLPLFVAALLTWIAGFVDAVGFLSLGGIYTANMSGNSVAIGIRAGSQNWPGMFQRLSPVVVYLAGLLLCRVLIEIGARKRIRAIAALAFAGEIALLLPACLAHAPYAASHSLVYVALLAMAMGIQNAALTKFSSLTVHTGFVTGTLLKSAEEFTKFLTWAADQWRKSARSLSSILADSPRQKPFCVAVSLGLIWMMYVIGACCGAIGNYRIRLQSLAIPVVGLAALMLLDLYHPLALAEEQEQASLSS